MRWWERAVIAAWWTLCAEAAVVLFLVGLRGVEDVLRGRAKRLAVEADSARGMTPGSGKIVGSKTAPAVQSANSGRGPDRPTRLSERNG